MGISCNAKALFLRIQLYFQQTTAELGRRLLSVYPADLDHALVCINLRVLRQTKYHLHLRKSPISPGNQIPSTFAPIYEFCGKHLQTLRPSATSAVYLAILRQSVRSLEKLSSTAAIYVRNFHTISSFYCLSHKFPIFAFLLHSPMRAKFGEQW